MCLKACATRQDFSIESTASSIMSGDVPTIEAIYNFYLRITKAIMYRIQSSSKRHLINLLIRSQVEENTSYNCREASSETYAPQNFKPKIKKSVVARR